MLIYGGFYKKYNMGLFNRKKSRQNYNNDEKYEDLKRFDRTIKKNPNDIAAWNGKGCALIMHQRYDEAIKCFDRAIEIEPINPEWGFIWGNKGFAFEQSGRYEEAIKCYDKALEIDPDDGINKMRPSREELLEKISKNKDNPL